ncbi:MAG TPA: hypothetical protein VFQ48_08690, partial [Pseudonocardiaceae bacterium]|nr:hypothetical protein [Pseudonocardiaceae bacterium]
ERDQIRERTSAGLAAARARGRHGGRPSVLTAHKLQVAQEMHCSGQYTVAAIATALGVSGARSTATWAVRAASWAEHVFGKGDGGSLLVLRLY